MINLKLETYRTQHTHRLFPRSKSLLITIVCMVILAPNLVVAGLGGNCILGVGIRNMTGKKILVDRIWYKNDGIVCPSISELRFPDKHIRIGNQKQFGGNTALPCDVGSRMTVGVRYWCKFKLMGLTRTSNVNAYGKTKTVAEHGGYGWTFGNMTVDECDFNIPCKGGTYEGQCLQ